jgi:small subunit ribosomal protein S1
MLPAMPEKDDFASLFEASARDAQERTGRRLRRGETVDGTVVQIGNEYLYVDVGTTTEARIARAELVDPEGRLLVALGDPVRATVVDLRGGSPLLAVAMGRDGHLDLGVLEAALASGAPVLGEVKQAVKSGLEVDLGGVGAFCPASQIDLGYVLDLAAFVGQRLEFRLLEIRDGGRSIVVSRRALLEEQRKERERNLLEQLRPGSELEGTVHSVQRHGAVVDLGGIEGFVHVSELSHHRVERPEDAVHVGETVRVRVLSVEQSHKGLRVRLSRKALLQPDDAARPPAPDEVLAGTVSRVSTFGVFVQTPKGEGLVPVRDLALPPGGDHRRVYPAGKAVQVVVTDHDATTGRMRFSITRVAEVEERRNYAAYAEQAQPSSSGSALGSLGDVLKDKLAARPPVKPAEVPPAKERPAEAPPRPRRSRRS